MPDVVQIAAYQIEVAERIRVVDQDWVEGLAVSIEVNGLMSPILVAQPKKGRSTYALIAGAHRLAAVKLLGWTEVPALVFAGSALEARLREIDENLIRRELSPLDRAAHLAERKRIYEELAPATKHGGDRRSDQVANLATWSERFTADAARKLGVSERDVQRAVARYTKIAPDVRETISRTWLAHKGAELDALARLSPDAQRTAISFLLSENEDRPRTVSAADERARGWVPSTPNAEDVAFAALVKAWQKAPKRARTRFIDQLVADGEILASQRAA